MQFAVNYHKKKTLQALRYHFIARNEIKILVILINVFAITSAILFYTKKIRPEYFLLGSVLWIVIMIAVWFILPYSVYKRAPLFKEQYIATLNAEALLFETEKGIAEWPLQKFAYYIETPHFFHLYFNPKSFILIPKEGMDTAMEHDVRGMLNNVIERK